MGRVFTPLTHKVYSATLPSPCSVQATRVPFSSRAAGSSSPCSAAHASAAGSTLKCMKWLFCRPPLSRREAALHLLQKWVRLVLHGRRRFERRGGLRHPRRVAALRFRSACEPLQSPRHPRAHKIRIVNPPRPHMHGHNYKGLGSGDDERCSVHHRWTGLRLYHDLIHTQHSTEHSASHCSLHQRWTGLRTQHSTEHSASHCSLHAHPVHRVYTTFIQNPKRLSQNYQSVMGRT